MSFHQFEGTSESRGLIVVWTGIAERTWKEKNGLKTHLKDELELPVYQR